MVGIEHQVYEVNSTSRTKSGLFTFIVEDAIRIRDRSLAWIGKHHNKTNLLLLLLASLVYSVNVYRLRPFTIDDAFISYRYADNLAAGYGLSWNYDSLPVFGFSNYLLVMLESIGIKLGFDPLIFSKVIGVGAGLLSIVLLGFLLKLLTDGKFKFYFAVSLVWALVPYGWVHAMSGLETTLFTLLIILSTYLYMCYLKSEKEYYLYLLLPSLMLTILCRYEGAAITLGILCHQIHLAFRAHSMKLGKLIVLSLPFGFLIGLLLWNHFYFGQALPNSFLVKSSNALTDIRVSVNVIVDFLLFLTPFVILILLGLETLLRNRLSSYLVIQSIVFLLPFVLVSQQMNYLYRFYYPIAPLIIVLGSLSLVLFGTWLQRGAWKYRLVSVVLVWAFLMCYAPLSSYQESMNFGLSYTGLNGCHVRIGKAFGEFKEYRNLTIATVIDAGAIPYYSHWRVFDYWLNDAYTAKHGFDLEYFYKQNPEVIIMTFYTGTSSEVASTMSKSELVDYLVTIQPDETQDRILEHPLFKDYTLVTVYKYGSWEYYEYIFMRDDIIGALNGLIQELRHGSNYW